MRVGYLGPPGTYSHGVANQFISSTSFSSFSSSFSSSSPSSSTSPSSFTLQPFGSIEAVIEATERKEVEVGIIPFENSNEGPVLPTLDSLCTIASSLSPSSSSSSPSSPSSSSSSSSPVRIIGEHYHSVDHCLIANTETKLEDISLLHSHPQAIGQCKYAYLLLYFFLPLLFFPFWLTTII